jgi:hypothetical protein
LSTTTLGSFKFFSIKNDESCNQKNANVKLQLWRFPDFRSVLSLGSTCTLLRSLADAESIWRPLFTRDFKKAAALYQPPDRQEDVNVTESAESKEHRWAVR